MTIFCVSSLKIYLWFSISQYRFKYYVNEEYKIRGSEY